MDQDGIDPGDSLSPLHTRKATVFYWSFADFGHTALQQEQAWFPVALALQSHLRNAVDGIGQLAALVVRELHARFGAGVSVDFNNGDQVTIWAKVHMMVADEPALKEMTSCKGHLCMNVVQDTQRVPGQPTRPGLWTYDATDQIEHVTPGADGTEKDTPQNDQAVAAQPAAKTGEPQHDRPTASNLIGVALYHKGDRQEQGDDRRCPVRAEEEGSSHAEQGYGRGGTDEPAGTADHVDGADDADGIEDNDAAM